MVHVDMTATTRQHYVGNLEQIARFMVYLDGLIRLL